MVMLTEDYEPQFGIFHDLMPFRVKEILLVSSFYDAFVLEEDGGLSEEIFSEYVDLNLRFIPRITRVSTGEEALAEIKKSNFDLVITMTRISDMDLLEFGQRVKELEPGLMVILLTYEWVTIPLLIRMRETKGIDKVFYWTGDSRILLAIIKYIEDVKNVENDIRLGVQVILVIEDSPRFFSMFLPIIYTEIMTQTRSLISEGLNDLHRMLRMRARPKILMAETYEEAKKLYKKYKLNLLGIISDVRFPRKGDIDLNAGFRFANRVKRELEDLPILLQSSNEENREKAYSKDLDFIFKHSQNLLFELRRFILSNFGFGDFVFKNTDGTEIGRAKNISEFLEILHRAPNESIELHASRNHISIWLRARTEFEVADKLRTVRISDFENLDSLRLFIISEIHKMNSRNQSGVIADFGQTKINYRNSFFRLVSGSLGGKARGIAFLNALLAKTRMAEKFEEVDIHTPHSFVICSGVFDEFIHENDLQEFAIMETRNKVIAKRFRKGRLPKKIREDLEVLLNDIHYPIAVRSSSLLEDSQMLPFAGLYDTFMLPNNSPNFKHRLRQLFDAVKLVYASVYYKSPKEYVRNTNFRTEEEKMAVIIQQVVGQEYKGKLYPVISGTAQSYNFYPISYMEPDDGVVELALGLGSIVAEGGQTYRVSPKYPEMNPPYSSAVEFMKKSQNFFYALDLSNEEFKIYKAEHYGMKRYDLSESESDGTLFFVGSTYSSSDNAIRDTISFSGPRVITFANMLKYNLFPLAEILREILKIGRESFGSHIEMEFAVNIFRDKIRKPEFYLLQARPMVAGQENVRVGLEDHGAGELVCRSNHSMGNGVFDELWDIVYVDPDTFDPAKTRIMAFEIGDINKLLSGENRNYILIGFGRWGTSDPWLGIPVEWFQISNVKVLVESNLGTFNIEPSQGSHFFHNLTSLGLGYLHIMKDGEDEFIDWDWVKMQKNRAETEYVKHIRLKRPLKVKIDARTSQGVILKPES